MPNEDKRAAVAVLTNLSGFIISASLAMLAIEGALFAFVLGNRDVSSGYYWASIAAFLFFVLSIVFGGWGTTKTAEKLAAGTWTVSVGSSDFNLQALFSFLGLLAFIGSALLSGSPKAADSQSHLTELVIRTNTLQTSVESLTVSNKKLTADLVALSHDLSKIQNDLTQRLDDMEKRAVVPKRQSKLKATPTPEILNSDSKNKPTPDCGKNGPGQVEARLSIDIGSSRGTQITPTQQPSPADHGHQFFV